ncbi:MAG: hypothetical protein M1132_13830 [Chloroflexi bacterium]|nr:hypothetical protein [Chloroflexota bacterium]
MSRIEREYRGDQDRDPQELIERFLNSGHYTPFDKAVRAEAKARSVKSDGKRPRAAEKEHASHSDLPIPEHDELTVEQIVPKLIFLSRSQVRALLSHEQKHKRRPEVVKALAERLKDKVPA